MCQSEMISPPRTPTTPRTPASAHFASLPITSTLSKSSVSAAESAAGSPTVLRDGSNKALEIGPEQLAQCLRRRLTSDANSSNRESDSNSGDLFVVDCRSFIQYNNCHIRSAVNAFYSKIMRRRLANDTVCADSILNHLSLAGATENVDLVLYGSDEECEGAPTEIKSVPSLKGVLALPSASCRKVTSGGRRTLYERRKQLEADSKNHSSETARVAEKSLSIKMPTTIMTDSCPRSAMPILDSTTEPGAPSFVRFLFKKLCNSTRLKFRRVMLLSDGFHDFRSKYPDLCESSRQQQKRQQKNEQTAKHDQCNVSRLNTEEFAIVTAPPIAGAEPIFYNSSTAENTNSDDEYSNLNLELDDFKALNDHLMNRPSTSLPPEMNGPTKIFDYLYLGTMADAEDEEFLRENGITCVINISEHPFRPSCVKNDAAHFKQINVKDSTDTKLRPLFDEVVKFIDNAHQNGEKVLIHCQAGISRSATLAIAYVIGNKRTTFREAYEFVKCRRAAIEPNFAFIYQLMRYSDELMKTDKSSTTNNQEEKNDEIVNATMNTDQQATSPSSERCSRLKVPSSPNQSPSRSSTNRSTDGSLSPYPNSPRSRSPNCNSLDKSPSRGFNSETRKRSVNPDDDKGKIFRRSYANKYAKTSKQCRSVDSCHNKNDEVPSPTSEFSKLDISLFPTSCGKLCNTTDSYNVDYLTTDTPIMKGSMSQLPKLCSPNTIPEVKLITCAEKTSYPYEQEAETKIDDGSHKCPAINGYHVPDEFDIFAEEISTSSDASTSSTGSGSMGSTS